MRKKKAPIIWSPQPKQAEALVRTEFEILYGGARGGGKTDAGMAWLLYNVSQPRFRALVIRKNAKDLADWIDRAKWMYRGAQADFTGSPTKITFPSGAVIRTGHLKDEDAYGQYQGHEYQNILIEELTQIPEERYYEKLISSCRSTVPELKPQVFCTTNPGEIGHQWVKRRWNIPDIPTGIVETETPFGGRVFIPSKVHDNPKLMDVDPGYVLRLESIEDQELRLQWLEGNWGNPIIPGLVYGEEMKASRLAGRIGEVPHDPRFPVYTWWDIGISDMTAIGFFQFIKGSWRLFDYYENSGKGLDHYVQVINARGYFYGGHFAPHDMANREWTSGESRLQSASNLGLHFQLVPKLDLADGINAVKMKLPILWIDSQKCAKAIDALCAYRREWDEEKQVFKNIPIHDWASHPSDMVRYWAITPDPVMPGLPIEDFNLYSTTYG